MISLEKWIILAPLQKLPKSVGDLGKFIVAKGFKKLPKVQKIAKSGHTAGRARWWAIPAEKSWPKNHWIHKSLRPLESV